MKETLCPRTWSSGNSLAFLRGRENTKIQKGFIQVGLCLGKVMCAWENSVCSRSYSNNFTNIKSSHEHKQSYKRYTTSFSFYKWGNWGMGEQNNKVNKWQSPYSHPGKWALDCAALCTMPHYQNTAPMEDELEQIRTVFPVPSQTSASPKYSLHKKKQTTMYWEPPCPGLCPRNSELNMTWSFSLDQYIHQ